MRSDFSLKSRYYTPVVVIGWMHDDCRSPAISFVFIAITIHYYYTSLIYQAEEPKNSLVRPSSCWVEFSKSSLMEASSAHWDRFERGVKQTSPALKVSAIIILWTTTVVVAACRQGMVTAISINHDRDDPRIKAVQGKQVSQEVVGG